MGWLDGPKTEARKIVGAASEGAVEGVNRRVRDLKTNLEELESRVGSIKGAWRRELRDFEGEVLEKGYARKGAMEKVKSEIDRELEGVRALVADLREVLLRGPIREELVRLCQAHLAEIQQVIEEFDQKNGTVGADVAANLARADKSRAEVEEMHQQTMGLRDEASSARHACEQVARDVGDALRDATRLAGDLRRALEMVEEVRRERDSFERKMEEAQRALCEARRVLEEIRAERSAFDFRTSTAWGRVVWLFRGNEGCASDPDEHP